LFTEYQPPANDASDLMKTIETAIDITPYNRRVTTNHTITRFRPACPQREIGRIRAERNSIRTPFRLQYRPSSSERTEEAVQSIPFVDDSRRTSMSDILLNRLGKDRKENSFSLNESISLGHRSVLSTGIPCSHHRYPMLASPISHHDARYPSDSSWNTWNKRSFPLEDIDFSGTSLGDGGCPAKFVATDDIPRNRYDIPLLKDIVKPSRLHEQESVANETTDFLSA
jgi:hypothetical protein